MFPDKGAINPSTGKAYAINPSSGNWDDNYYENWKKSQPGYAQFQQQEQAKQDQNNLLAKQKQETDARFASNKQELGDFNTRYGAAVPQAINDTQNKYQIGELLGQTNALGSRVKDLRSNISGAGAGGYANANQVDAAINTKYLPAYQSATENLQRGSTLAQNEESMLLQPYQMEASMLNDRLSREASGYSQEQERELSTLIGQMNAGIQLTQAQMQQATQLAQLEQGKYEFEKQLQASKDATQIIEVGGRKLLVNSATGQTVKDLGSSASGSGNGAANLGAYLTPTATNNSNPYAGMTATQYNSLLGGGAPTYFKPI